MTVLANSPIPATCPEPDTPPRRWKWTGADLLRMGEAGLLPPEGRFELLDGEIYQLMPPGTLHTAIVNRLLMLFQEVGVHGAFLQCQSPVRLNEHYQPEPDIVIIRGASEDFEDRFPGPEEIALLIEVGSSSLEHDQGLKLRAYAAAEIPEYWLVNLPEQRLEVYREPVEAEYRTRYLYRRGDSVAPVSFPGIVVPVAQLLGKPKVAEVQP